MGTGVLRLLGAEVENRYVRRGPTSYSIIGEAMFRLQDPDFPLATNSALKPVSGCARPHRFKGHGCSQVNGRARDYDLNDSWRRF